MSSRPETISREAKDSSKLDSGVGLSPSSGFTFKAFFVGALLSLAINLGTPYGNMYLRGSYMALDFSTAAALFAFFILVGAANVALGLVRKSLALNRAELATVYIMMIVATSIPTMGLTEYLLPIITGAFYYATPENDWTNLIHPYIPDWMVLPQGEEIKYFYEGLPKGDPIPWGVWVKPLIYWCSFIIALYFVMTCIMAILRKQWIEKERLIYPMVQVPLEMIRDDEGRSLVKPFFKNPAMWVGFAIPFIIGCVKALHNYYHFIPTINLATTVPIFRQSIGLRIALSFPMLGFSYFINLDIALGIWFFYLLTTVEQGIFNITGFTSTENLAIYGNPASPYLAHQGLGAMMVFVIFGLWVARGHLRDVFRKAFRNDSNVDDSGEILSYRSATFGLIAGLLFMGFWLWRSGLPALIVPLFLLSALAIFTALTRVVVEGGVAAARAPMLGSDFVVSGVGTPALGPAGMVSLAFTYIWHADIRTFVMASCANGLKLGEEVISGSKRPLFWAVMLAIVVSLVGSIWVILYLSYTYGGINLNQWFFVGGPQAPFNYIAPKLTTPTSADFGGWAFNIIGGVTMALLMFARHRLLWWPLHPLGFTISTVSLMTGWIWFSVFLAWLLKSLILKYGGPVVYRRTRPFFLGLILGQFVVAGMWLFIDYFTGMTDNNIYWV